MKLRIIPPDKFTDNVIQRWITKHNSLIGSLISFLFFCVFLFLFVLFLLRWTEYRSTEKILQSEGIRTQGKVISIKIWRGSGGKRSISTSFYPTVEFLDNNSVKHRFESKYDFRCRVGDVVSVMYLPSKPEIAVIESAGADEFPIIGIIGLITALLLATYLLFCCTIYPIIARKRRKQKKRKNTKANKEF